MWETRRRRRAGSLTVCVALVFLGTAGCGDQDRLAREKACVAAANKEAEELKGATAELLSPDIMDTATENNSCDSGVDGAYVTLYADRSTPAESILRESRARGWRKTDPPSDDCFACVAQVEKIFKGRIVRLSVLERGSDPDFEIEALYNDPHPS